MSQVIFRNARIFDGHSGDCAEGMSVRTADGRIQEIGAGSLYTQQCREFLLAANGQHLSLIMRQGQIVKGA